MKDAAGDLLTNEALHKMSKTYLTVPVLVTRAMAIEIIAFRAEREARSQAEKRWTMEPYSAGEAGGAVRAGAKP